jgi:predicted acetyltransferase
MKLIPASPTPPPGLSELLADIGPGENGFGGTPVAAGGQTIAEFLAACCEGADPARVRPGLVPQTVYWLTEDDGTAVGMVRVRHRLNDMLLIRGGHIGYFIRRDRRRRGYGAVALRLALDELRGFGESRALLTVHPGNLPSTRVIETNGGRFADETADPETGDLFKRYWIDLDLHPRPRIGAIRWDAWSGGPVTRQVEKTLGPAKYHHRLPWFADVLDDSRVRIDGSPQGVTDREIEFAADAGLDYWAFLLYPESESMSDGLKSYLRSAGRKRIRFCLILHNAFGVPEDQWPRERDRAVGLLKEPGYQTVLGGRPLVFAFALGHKGAFPAARFAEFIETARLAGLDPYCVHMGWNPTTDFAAQSPRGFEAVSAYAYAKNEGSFAELASGCETDYWANAAAGGVPYIPLVTTGWDKQPRKDNPVSWELDHSYHKQARFPDPPAPAEIAQHLGRALAFVGDHPGLCPARAVIVYAWNEYDEGGWLAPTRGLDGAPDTARLDALRACLS